MWWHGGDVRCLPAPDLYYIDIITSTDGVSGVFAGAHSVMLNFFSSSDIEDQPNSRAETTGSIEMSSKNISHIFFSKFFFSNEVTAMRHACTLVCLVFTRKVQEFRVRCIKFICHVFISFTMFAVAMVPYNVYAIRTFR